MKNSRTGVLLLNLGGPDSLESVEPFLVNLFSDRDIIQLPLGGLIQPIFARVLSRVRGPSVRRNYASIGGRSPQLPLTLEQARALEARLNRDGVRASVRVGMRYWRPTIAEALDGFIADGIDEVVALPLYPQYSVATTGSSYRELDRAAAASPRRAALRISRIEAYADHPLYLDAMSDRVREALEAFPADRRDGVVLLFTAHGLPESFVRRGDPYVNHVAATVRGVLARLSAPNRHALGYQSRTGPVRWIGPGTEEVIASLGREGVEDLLMIPVSFVSDHIETLYEIDQLFAGDARAAGMTTVRRSAALETHPRFIEALADLVESRIRGRQ